MSGFTSSFFGTLAVQKSQKIILSTLLAAIGFTHTAVMAQNYITNGVGAYTEFNERTLLIKLELQAPATDPAEVMDVDTPKKLSFRIMQNRSPRAWSKIWIQNLSINNSPDTLATQTDDLIAMTQALQGSLRTGDLVEFERIAADLTVMTINGQEVADFETPNFFEFLMTAFIGSIPPSSELKSKLLAGGRDFGDEAILFDSLGFTEQRAAQIAAWGAGATNLVSGADVPTQTMPEQEETETEDPEQGQEPQAETSEVAGTDAELPTETVEAMEATETDETDAQDLAASEQEARPEPELAEDEEDEAPVRITAESLMAVQNYQRSVLQAVYRELEYPRIAQRRNREGSLRLAIAINSNGSASTIEVTESAQYQVFDEAAIEAIEDALPFDPLPEGTTEIPMVLEIPIAFRLQ